MGQSLNRVERPFHRMVLPFDEGPSVLRREEIKFTKKEKTRDLSKEKKEHRKARTGKIIPLSSQTR